MRELCWAIGKEKLIMPIYYRDCPKGMYCSFKDDDEENKFLNKESGKLVELSKSHYVDFRNLRNKKIESEVVQGFLDKMSKEISEKNT